MSAACYSCGAALGTVERIGRRDACLRCGAELHCCRNCQFYDPALHNQCREPQAEPQVDKERANFCDYFSVRAAGAGAAPAAGARDALDALLARKKAR